MKDIQFQGESYSFVEKFDVNLTLEYECSKWGAWHILREFISNALDAVEGNITKIKVEQDGDYLSIGDQGDGYPLSFAKRIGASSKKKEVDLIGQFGEGTKMAILTALRLELGVFVASQNWLIEPVIEDEDGLSVLFYNIYVTENEIMGSTVTISNPPEIEQIITNLSKYFLYFKEEAPLFGVRNMGIYQKIGVGNIYNKGVWIKEVDALFDYALKMEEINRDRDIIDSIALDNSLEAIWNKVDNEKIMEVFWKNSVLHDSDSTLLEYKLTLYPDYSNHDKWNNTFHKIFGDNTVMGTDKIASHEVTLMGYKVITLQYCAGRLAKYIGVKSDVDVCRKDYEFTWTDRLSIEERERWHKLKALVVLTGRELLPVKFFDAYAKSENVMGIYDSENKAIYLKREILRGPLAEGLEIVLHEMNHSYTNASDYDRKFTDGLDELAAKLLLNVAREVGKPILLKLSARGFEFPDDFSFTSAAMTGFIACVGHGLIIEVNGIQIKAYVEKELPPYASKRNITFHNGHFYLNTPSKIRELLPQKVLFYIPIF